MVISPGKAEYDIHHAMEMRAILVLIFIGLMRLSLTLPYFIREPAIRKTGDRKRLSEFEPRHGFRFETVETGSIFPSPHPSS